MKRLLVLSATALAVAAPATAAAATSTSVDASSTARAGSPDLTINFDIFSTPGGKPVEIRKFKFKKLEADCKTGEPQVVNGKIGLMKINDNKKFDGKVKEKGGKVAVEGVVKNGGRKVTGKIRAKGKFAPSKGCDSGKVRWKATAAR